MTTPRDPSTRLPFRRLLDNGQDNTSWDSRLDGNGPTLLLRHYITTATTMVYRTNGVTVKTFLPKCQWDLDNEVKVYRYLMHTSALRYIPTFCGYFGYRKTKAIILSDEGPAPFYDFSELSHELK
jgi:hypothetical protein